MLRHFGVDGFAFDVWVERCATVVTKLEGKTLGMDDNFLDATLAQQGFDFTGDFGVFVFGTEQGPDDAVINVVTVAGAEADAIFLQTFVVEAADDGTQRFRRAAQRGLQEGDRGAQ